MNIPHQIKPGRGARQVLALCVTLVMLGACGPTTPSESTPPDAPGTTAHLPFDAREVVRQARAGLDTTPPTISAELPANTQAGTPADDEPAVAAGDGLYLVVWREDYARPPSIVGARVRALDGALLDASPIRIHDAPWSAQHPAVAFDGNNFLVVWEETTKGTSHIMGTRVRASDGARLNNPEVLSASWYPTDIPPPMYSFPQYAPAVAFDGVNYLVVWTGQVYRPDGSVVTALNGNRVNPSTGGTVERYSFIVSEASSGLRHRVAYGAGRYLVVWHASFGGQQGDNIRGVRIDASSRAVLDTTPLAITSAVGDERNPVVASSGNQFLVVWNGSGGALRGTRVRIADGAVLDSTPLAVGEGAAGAEASVTFDGGDYRVSWQGARDGVPGLFSTKVPLQGGVDASAELTLSGIHASTTKRAASIGATEEGRLLVAYTQYDAGTSRHRIKLRLVDDAPSEEPCETGTPTLVITGGANLTLECGSAAYSDQGAQAWDGCGNPLQVQAYNSGNDPHGPGPLTSAEGIYEVTYIAIDALGQTASAVRTVQVDDQTAPTLQLIGPASSTHTCGSQWVDPGVTSTDACYTNVAETVQTAGWVNGWAEGVYTLTYSVTDSGGNSAASVTRTVEVVDCPW